GGWRARWTLGRTGPARTRSVARHGRYASLRSPRPERVRSALAGDPRRRRGMTPEDMLADDLALSMPLDGMQLIEASAGTGKTFTIAGLYVRSEECRVGK